MLDCLSARSVVGLLVWLFVQLIQAPLSRYGARGDAILEISMHKELQNA